MKRTVYLDSTIPSYLFDERESLKTYIEVTKAWWEQERDNFDLWISEETIAELSTGSYPNKQQILVCVAELQVVPPSADILHIAQVYLARRRRSALRRRRAAAAFSRFAVLGFR